MTRRELEVALADAVRVRDEWCAEYVKVRDRLARLKRKIGRGKADGALRG